MPRNLIRVAILIVLLLVLDAGGSSRAADSDQARDYFVLRAGGTYFNNPDESPFAELDNPALEGFVGGAIGVNFDRHWGVELAAEFIETALLQPGTGETIAEYALWTILAQTRVRFPLWRDRLTPYLIVGAGVGLGEQNDRNFLNAGAAVGKPAIPLDGPSDTVFVGAIGAGIEYFVTDNIAFGLEAKRFFVAKTDLEYAGQPTQLDPDFLAGSIGMRVYLDKPPEGNRKESKAADGDETRFYLALRAGAAFFTDPDAVPSAQIATPVAFGGGAIGLNISRFWGVEFVAEGLGPLEASLLETSLSTPGVGEVVEYSMWTNVLQARLRYPVLQDTLVPYLVAGPGLGYTDFNDRRVPQGTTGIGSGSDNTSFVAAIGAGIEYFVANDIALGVEAKHVFLFEDDITVNASPAQLQLDPVFLNLSLRIFF